MSDSETKRAPINHQEYNVLANVIAGRFMWDISGRLIHRVQQIGTKDYMITASGSLR